MTPRQRVLSAIAHEEPERVPVDLGATPSSGISAIAYGRLKRHLGIETGHNRVYDVVQQLSEPEDDILERFGIDAVDLGRTFNAGADDWYEVTLFDGSRAEYPNWFRPDPTPDGGWKSHAPDGTDGKQQAPVAQPAGRGQVRKQTLGLNSRSQGREASVAPVERQPGSHHQAVGIAIWGPRLCYSFHRKGAVNVTS